MFINQYTEEDSALNDCRTGNTWQDVIISRVKEGCNRFKHTPSGQDTYRKLDFDRNGRVEKLGLYCGVDCSECEEIYTNLNWGECVVSQDSTSAALYAKDNLCRGSTIVELATGGITMSYFESGGCEMDAPDAEDNVVTIRGYPQVTNMCERDGITKFPLTYYNLKIMTNKSGSFYQGYLNCTTSDCTPASCVVTVTDWRAGECRAITDGRFMQITSNEELQRCEIPQQPTSHKSTPTPFVPTLGPQARADEVVIAASLGVVLIGAGIAASIFYFRGGKPKSRKGYQTIHGQSREPARGVRRGRRSYERGYDEQGDSGRQSTEYNGM